jgi:hypothetical protein
MPQAPARRAASESPDVAKLVTLHHRRRGWAWVAIGSLIGLAVYAGIDVNLLGNLTGAAEVLSAIPVFVLLALVLAGLVVVIVDTSRIHRADAAVRASAKGGVSHVPLYAHAHHYPPRHHGSWVFVIVMLVAMTGIAVALLPSEVNAWGYVVGAENQDTFNPASYSQACLSLSRYGGGCHTVTEGYLSKSGAHVTWGSQVPLGQPFTVHDPLWAWGHRADSHQRRRLGHPGDHRGPVLRRLGAPVPVRPRRDSARHAVATRPADARAPRRRPGENQPNAPSCPRPPRKRRPPSARPTLRHHKAEGVGFEPTRNVTTPNGFQEHTWFARATAAATWLFSTRGCSSSKIIPRISRAWFSDVSGSTPPRPSDP